MTTASALIPSVIAILTPFAFSVDSGHLWTLITVQKGRDLTINGFRKSELNEHKADFVFTNFRNHWKSIDEEVRGWIEANWTRWHDEKSRWFDEALQAHIPLVLIPSAAERKREKKACLHLPPSPKLESTDCGPETPFHV